MSASAHAHTGSAKARTQGNYRRAAEERAASVTRKQRLNQVREAEAGEHQPRRRKGGSDFMASIGYGHAE